MGCNIVEAARVSKTVECNLRDWRPPNEGLERYSKAELKELEQVGDRIRNYIGYIKDGELTLDKVLSHLRLLVKGGFLWSGGDLQWAIQSACRKFDISEAALKIMVERKDSENTNTEGL